MCQDKRNYTVTLDRTGAKRGFLHYLAVFFWIGWTFFYFCFFLSLPLLYMYCKPLLTAIVGLMLISAFTPIKRELQPKFIYKFGEWVMHKAADYFNMKIIVEDKEALDKCKQVIFTIEPHDILPLSIFAFNDCLSGLKSLKCLGCVTSACFKVPLMRHVYTWMNAYSVDKKDVLKIISKGYSPVICPGGVAEVIYLENRKELVLFMKKRFGYIKIAVQHGIPIVPVMAFGLRDSFNFYVSKNEFLCSFGRKAGFLPLWFTGVFGTPLGPAKPCNYTNVIAPPIIVKKIEKPSEDDLQKYQALVHKELKRIFETYKEEFGMGDVTLKII